MKHKDKQVRSILLTLDNQYLNLIDYKAEMNMVTFECGTTMYYVSIKDVNYDYSDWKEIASGRFEDINTATKWIEETSTKYVTEILQERIKQGEWAKKRLADMNQFGMFN
jgi:Zn-dependent peptidase ImmA (M78 family)